MAIVFLQSTNFNLKNTRKKYKSNSAYLTKVIYYTFENERSRMKKKHNNLSIMINRSILFVKLHNNITQYYIVYTFTRV